MLHKRRREGPAAAAIPSRPAPVAQRIEQALQQALALGEGPAGPPLLAAAMRHAVFPGGARIRPQLCLAVAGACGDAASRAGRGRSRAIELLHCASLVHDDLPCFDDAATRRGVPSVHAPIGERIAVLTGDALIVLAFQALAEAAEPRTQRLLAPLIIAARQPRRRAQRHRRRPGLGVRAAGVAGRLPARQDRLAVRRRHRSRRAGRGADPAPWRAFGECLGEAYQVADDMRDVVATTAGARQADRSRRDLSRPSSASELGLGGAIEHFDRLVERSIEAIPACDGAHAAARHDAGRIRAPGAAGQRARPGVGCLARAARPCRPRRSTP